MTVTQHSGSAFDLKLSFGKDRERSLGAILEGRGDTVEVKCDEQYGRTGNVAIEFKQSDGKGGEKPSGIAASEAYWWATEFLPGRWLVLPREVVLEAARVQWKLETERAKRIGREFRGVPMGDNGNVGVLVPLSALIDPWMLSPHETRDAA